MRRFHVLSMAGTVIRNQFFFSSVWFSEETEQVDEAMSYDRAFVFVIPWTLILISNFIKLQETKYDDLSQISVINRNHCSSSSIQLSNWKYFSVSIWIFMNSYCFSTFCFLFSLRVTFVTQCLWKKNSLILMLKKLLLFIIVRK